MKPASDLEVLQGEWSGRGPAGPCSITIAGNTLSFYAREDHWYKTTFTLPADATLPQLHATIVEESSPQPKHVGAVVITLFKIEGDSLTLGVTGSYDEPPEGAVADGWDAVQDRYFLQRASSGES